MPRVYGQTGELSVWLQSKAVSRGLFARLNFFQNRGQSEQVGRMQHC